MPLLILLIGLVVVFTWIVDFFDAYGITLLAFSTLVVAFYVLYRLVRYIRKILFFRSKYFLAIKADVASLVAEHNELVEYVSEMRARRAFTLGTSSTGSQAHLASFDNTSQHQYRRDRNSPDYESQNVHNCSLQVVRNASANPIMYLMKYFGIKADEDTLSAIEEIGESLSRIEQGLDNLREREEGITKKFNPPTFILKHYMDEFMSHVGVKLSTVSVPYSVYAFEYVSAGGNSSQRTTVKLDGPTIDAILETLSQKIKWKKSAAGQRALMTAKFRDFIKARDKYACRQCSISVETEPHLLLEVDHIIPLSKGGLSTQNNLQTLCWRCNRKKAAKIFDDLALQPPTSPRFQ